MEISHALFPCCVNTGRKAGFRKIHKLIVTAGTITTLFDGDYFDVFNEQKKTECKKDSEPTTTKYLLLTEFEVRTVSYDPSFFPLI